MVDIKLKTPQDICKFITDTVMQLGSPYISCKALMGIHQYNQYKIYEKLSKQTILLKKTCKFSLNASQALTFYMCYNDICHTFGPYEQAHIKEICDEIDQKYISVISDNQLKLN